MNAASIGGPFRPAFYRCALNLLLAEPADRPGALRGLALHERRRAAKRALGHAVHHVRHHAIAIFDRQLRDAEIESVAPAVEDDDVPVASASALLQVNVGGVLPRNPAVVTQERIDAAGLVGDRRLEREEIEARSTPRASWRSTLPTGGGYASAQARCSRAARRRRRAARCPSRGDRTGRGLARPARFA